MTMTAKARSELAMSMRRPRSWRTGRWLIDVERRMSAINLRCVSTALASG